MDWQVDRGRSCQSYTRIGGTHTTSSCERSSSSFVDNALGSTARTTSYTTVTHTCTHTHVSQYACTCPDRRPHRNLSSSIIFTSAVLTVIRRKLCFESALNNLPNKTIFVIICSCAVISLAVSTGSISILLSSKPTFDPRNKRKHTKSKLACRHLL